MKETDIILGTIKQCGLTPENCPFRKNIANVKERHYRLYCGIY